MRGLLVVGVAVAAAWVPAAPAVTVTTEPADPRPRFRVLPDVPDRPDDGCILPVGSSLDLCPRGDRLRAPVACVLPVDQSPGTTVVTPECPRWHPAPEGRVVPVVPFTR